MEEATAWRRKGSPGVEEEEPRREEAQDRRAAAVDEEFAYERERQRAGRETESISCISQKGTMVIIRKYMYLGDGKNG
jgi:hypothetical protein